MKKKSNELSVLRNTLFCSNHSACNNTVTIGKDEEELLLYPLCADCEESLVRQAGNNKDQENGDDEEDEEEGFVPFDLTKGKEEEVRGVDSSCFLLLKLILFFSLFLSWCLEFGFLDAAIPIVI